MPERHLTVGQCRPCFRSSRPAVQPLRQELCPGWLARLHYLPGQGAGCTTCPAKGPAALPARPRGWPRHRYPPGQGVAPASLPARPRAPAIVTSLAKGGGLGVVTRPAKGSPRRPGPRTGRRPPKEDREVPGGVLGHGPVLLRDQVICWQLIWPEARPPQPGLLRALLHRDGDRDCTKAGRAQRVQRGHRRPEDGLPWVVALAVAAGANGQLQPPGCVLQIILPSPGTSETSSAPVRPSSRAIIVPSGHHRRWPPAATVSSDIMPPENPPRFNYAEPVSITTAGELETIFSRL